MRPRRSGVKEQIVEAAVQLFSHKGFNGTSTREIARLADVDETSIFRHFPRKRDLFWAAVQSRLARVRFRKELETGLEENRDPAIVLPLLIEFLVHTATYHSELIRLISISLLELRPGAERVLRQHVSPIFRLLTDYMERGIRSQTVRKVDASIVVTACVATVLSHQALHQCLTGTPGPYASTEEASLAYRSFWLEFLLPNTSQSAESELAGAELVS